MMFPLEFVYNSSQTELGFAPDFFFSLCGCGIDCSLSLKNLLLKENTFLMIMVNSRKNALEIT